MLSQWLKLASDDVKEQIFKLAKKGLTPSQIGKKDILPMFVGFPNCNPKGDMSAMVRSG